MATHPEYRAATDCDLADAVVGVAPYKRRFFHILTDRVCSWVMSTVNELQVERPHGIPRPMYTYVLHQGVPIPGSRCHKPVKFI